MTTPSQKDKSDKAAALKDGEKVGPKTSPVQVRDAGKENTKNQQQKWDEQDEELDESFPASDPPANY